MPAANYNPDAPLGRLAPSGGWIGTEPTGYAVRAKHAEAALDVVIYCHYVHLGDIPARLAGRVARSQAELSELPELRTFDVLIGHKPGQGKATWLAAEIVEIEEAA